MTRVVFYVGIADRYDFLRRFLHRKVFLAQRTALIYAHDQAMVEALDKALWEDFFLPHQCLSADETAPESADPIVLTSTPPATEFVRDMVVLCAAEVPTALVGRFEICVDMVGASEKSKQAGRSRYRYFQDHGYDVEVINMGRK